MKVKVAPSQLKHGQLFDAIEKSDPNCKIYNCEFKGINNSGYIIAPKGWRIPVKDYDFFIEVTHPDLVRQTAKSGQAILDELTPQKCDYMHFGSNLAGEVGEIWDALKKHIFYGKEIDKENLVEELGDLEWYLEGLRQTAGITREETLDHNISKLSKRYAEGYSNEAAQARADKQ